MKTNIKLIVDRMWSLALATTAFLCFAKQTSLADETNKFYFTLYAADLQKESGFESDFSRWHHVLKKPLSRTLPSEQDPEGNWGKPVDGYQMSIRLRRQEFVKGEPVIVFIIIRNLLPIMREDFFSYWTNYHAFEYTLHQGSNVITWKMPPDSEVFGNHFASSEGRPSDLPPFSQMLYVIHLDEIFDLKKIGEYSIQAHRVPPFKNLRGRSAARVTPNVASGTAQFRIVNKLSPSEIEATNNFALEVKHLEQRYLHFK